MRKLSRVGPPDARKRACPVRAGAGRKPTAERQKWAPSFDQHYRHIGEEDKIGSDNSAFSLLYGGLSTIRVKFQVAATNVLKLVSSLACRTLIFAAVLAQFFKAFVEFSPSLESAG